MDITGETLCRQLEIGTMMFDVTMVTEIGRHSNGCQGSNYHSNAYFNAGNSLENGDLQIFQLKFSLATVAMGYVKSITQKWLKVTKTNFNVTMVTEISCHSNGC